MSSRWRGISRIVAAAKCDDFFIGCVVKPTETEAKNPPIQAYHQEVISTPNAVFGSNNWSCGEAMGVDSIPQGLASP